MSETPETFQNSEQNPEESDVVTLTLNDILDMENEMMEDAAAVLGGSNDKTCSYNDGYLRRQALYSCLTCIPEARQDAEKGAGICLACSYHCHDGHELIELYTKRNFRCDCGNSKFGSDIKCNLVESKSEVNELNQYNQNFTGLYCVCHRPYPDPEDPLPDEMIQCIVCEDWYHSRHLGAEIPSTPFAEMICASCVSKHEFILYYDGIKCEEEKESVDVESTDETKPKTSDEKTEEDNKPAEPTNECRKPKEKGKPSTKFWPDISWRKQLCQCTDCLKIYEEEKMLFLIDPEDPVHTYEEKGKAKAKEVNETNNQNLANSINSLDRVQLVEAISGYNEFKESLAEYLKKFVEAKKVVREEDVREFFDGMMARKKQKVGTTVPHFCR